MIFAARQLFDIRRTIHIGSGWSSNRGNRVLRAMSSFTQVDAPDPYHVFQKEEKGML